MFSAEDTDSTVIFNFEGVPEDNRTGSKQVGLIYNTVNFVMKRH
jgi:hypothetical protein